MNSESSRLRSTGTTSSDMSAIWPGALLVVYLAATGLLLAIGGERERGGPLLLHVSVLVAVAAATWAPAAPGWLRDWAPLLTILFLYSEMPTLIAAAGHATTFDATVMRWEHGLFRFQPALRWAPGWPSAGLSEVLHAAYLSYYGIIIVVPAALYVARRRNDFSEATFGLMFTFIACFAFYIAFPVAGPRFLFAPDPESPNGPIRRATLWLLEARSSRGTAFPSSHVAVAVTQSIFAVRYFGRKGAGIALLALGLALGAVYGAFHYAVDVLAGAAFGLVMAAAGLRVYARLTRPPAQANAIAPT